MTVVKLFWIRIGFCILFAVAGLAIGVWAALAQSFQLLIASILMFVLTYLGADVAFKSRWPGGKPRGKFSGYRTGDQRWK